jgi:UDPglucose--hexose-1-phosphate uridylyltransferase
MWAQRGACQYCAVTRGEFRFDPLTREWVNIVGHRQSRPNLPDSACPFCVGGLEAPEPYEVHWFANRWPALEPGEPVVLDGACVPAIGACEVVLFAPDHDASLATLPVDHVRKVVDLWAARTDALLSRPEIEYVLVFENRGEEVGATISHPHGQIFGYPFVPPVPAREGAVARANGCPLCWRPDDTLIVTEAGDWIASVPYASRYPYGMLVAPRRHVGSIRDLDAAMRDDLSRVLIDALARYDRLWPSSDPAVRFPYLLWFHQAPAGGGDEWHLHAHTAPPMRAPGVARFVASGELGSGTLANPVVPEDAAAALKDAG